MAGLRNPCTSGQATAVLILMQIHEWTARRGKDRCTDNVIESLESKCFEHRDSRQEAQGQGVLAASSLVAQPCDLSRILKATCQVLASPSL